MVTSQVLKFVDFTETQKFRYFEGKTFFSSNKKNSLITHRGLLYGKKQFLEEVTFKS